MEIKSIEFMKNFDFKASLKMLWAIITAMAVYMSIAVFLPKWCSICAFAAFILFCLYDVGLKQPHYWLYIKYTGNVSFEVGVIKTYEDKTPIGCLGNIGGLSNIAFYEISREHFEALYEAMNKAKSEKQDTSKNDDNN